MATKTSPIKIPRNESRTPLTIKFTDLSNCWTAGSPSLRCSTLPWVSAGCQGTLGEIRLNTSTYTTNNFERTYLTRSNIPRCSLHFNPRSADSQSSSNLSFSISRFHCSLISQRSATYRLGDHPRRIHRRQCCNRNRRRRIPCKRPL